jgi:hypothetical protein
MVCGQAAQLLLLIGVRFGLQTGDHNMSLFDSLGAVVMLSCQLASCMLTIFLPATAARGWLALGMSEHVLSQCTVGFYVLAYSSLFMINGMLLWRRYGEVVRHGIAMLRGQPRQRHKRTPDPNEPKVHILYDTLNKDIHQRLKTFKSDVLAKSRILPVRYAEREVCRLSELSVKPHLYLQFFGLEAKLIDGHTSPFVSGDKVVILLSNTFVNRVCVHIAQLAACY